MIALLMFLAMPGIDIDMSVRIVSEVSELRRLHTIDKTPVLYIEKEICFLQAHIGCNIARSEDIT